MSRRGFSTGPLKAMIAALDLELLPISGVLAVDHFHGAVDRELAARRRDAQLAAQPCVDAAAAYAQRVAEIDAQVEPHVARRCAASGLPRRGRCR